MWKHSGNHFTTSYKSITKIDRKSSVSHVDFRCFGIINKEKRLSSIILKSPGVCKASICREVFNKETFHKTILRPPVVKQVYKIIWNPYEFHRFYLTSPTI